MKIIILMPLGEQQGGSEKNLLDLISEKILDVEWVVIFQEDGSLVKQIEDLGVKTRVVPSGRLRQPIYFISAIIKIAKIAKKEKADAILSWMWKAHFYGSLAAIIAGIPSLWSQLEVPDSNLLKKIVAKLPSSGVITNSKSAKINLEKLCPQQQVNLTYPGVALHDFDPDQIESSQEIRRKLGLSIDVPIIGIVGRLQRWKGMHVLLQAMPTILEKYPQAHCLIVGGKHKLESDYAEFLEQTIIKLNLQKQVTLTGFQKNIPEWVQAMDIFVHASYNEPFGIVVVEAMALGKPVIASDSGGPTEIIENGVQGILTPYGDYHALATAILKYLDNPKFAFEIAQAGKQRSKDFSTQKYATNVVKAIREFILQV
jgi:glycosyltransferase involved in cell wall biosynthesis